MVKLHMEVLSRTLIEIKKTRDFLEYNHTLPLQFDNPINETDAKINVMLIRFLTSIFNKIPSEIL
jgi:hypothetical protein